MSAPTLTQADPNVTTTLRLLEEFTTGFPKNVHVRLWDGTTWSSQPDQSAEFTLVLRHAGALRQMMWPFSAVAFGESYIFDDFDIEGDIFAFTPWIAHLLKLRADRPLSKKLQLLWLMLKLPRQGQQRDVSLAGTPTETAHALKDDRRGISFTYDRPGAFYRLFLGPTMQYTCSYFADLNEDLDTSQTRKLDHICRKLRLRSGQRLLDIGCGWGNLLIHAAKHFGVEAVGVTLAGEQAEWCERAIRENGLADRIKIVCCDYREMPFAEAFDAAVSVGMGEHVGRANLPLFFRKVCQVLKPGGTYLHHGITIRPDTPYPRWTAFSHKYVFPNGELHSILELQGSAARAGFEIRDVENRREHYPPTLRAWVRQLEANHDAVVQVAGEVNYRIHRLYMAGATLGFDSGIYQLYQTLMVKLDEGRAGLPLTRADWYTPTSRSD